MSDQNRDETTNNVPSNGGFGDEARPEQPRFGRRAEDEPGYVPPTQPPQTAPQHPNYSQPGYGQQPPQGYGYPQPGQVPPQYPGQYRAPYVELPGRGLPITLIVLGLVTMLIIAPIVLIGGVAVGSISGVLDKIDPESGSTVTNGATVEVDSIGFYGVVIPTSADEATCVLSGENGTIDLPRDENGGAAQGTLFVGQNIPAGTYELQCANLPDNAQLIALDSALVSSLFSALGKSTLAAGVVGVIGLALMIWGIVKLVKVNKRRREMMLQMQGWQ
ncbi:MAG: hypothetical protein Q4P71_07560 [Actinomycetaceae bacterium]|nr:hypothetical protein [Actinomycetaceae bacterium]